MPDPLRDEHLLRAYLESSEDAVVEVCRDGKIVRWSRGAARLYGYTEEEVRAHSLALLVPIYEVPVLEATLEDLRRGEIRRSETTERMKKDGSCVCVSVRKTAIRDEHGQVTGMIESARALMPTDSDSPAERQLRLLVVQMPIMLWTTDRQLRITSNWGSGFQLSQIDSGKLVGRTIPEFLRCADSGSGPVMRHFDALRGIGSRFEYARNDRVLDIQVEPLRSPEGGNDWLPGRGTGHHGPEAHGRASVVSSDARRADGTGELPGICGRTGARGEARGPVAQYVCDAAA